MLIDVISIFVIHFYVVHLIFLHSFSTEENILCQAGLGDVRSLEVSKPSKRTNWGCIDLDGIRFDFEMDMC